MVIIVGALYSGKMSFAKENFSDREIITNVDEMVRNAINDGLTNNLLSDLLNKKDSVIILDELGCGITPMKKEDRIFREIYGRIGIALCDKAKKVYRINFGIPTCIKEVEN